MQKTNTVIAVDVGGTKILIGEVDQSGNVLQSRKFPSSITNQVEVEKQIINDLGTFMNEVTFIGEPQAIGVGIVGRVDVKSGIWDEIAPGNAQPQLIAADIAAKFGLPCAIGNDVYSATLAELNLGIGQRYRDFIYLNIGTGIAAGIVADGKIIVGHDHDAGEVGHMVVDMDSTVKCVCGRYGCAEVLGSGLGMSNRALSLLSEYPNSSLQKAVHTDRIAADALYNAYDQGDKLARIVVNDAIAANANLIMNLVKAFNPAAIVLGGGATADGWLLNHIEQELNAEAMRFVSGGVTLTQLDPATIALKGAALNASRKVPSAHEIAG